MSGVAVDIPSISGSSGESPAAIPFTVVAINSHQDLRAGYIRLSPSSLCFRCLRTRLPHTYTTTWIAQEPAAALFSIFNLLSTLVAWRKFRSCLRSKIGDQEIAGDPLVLVTDVSALLAMHAWSVLIPFVSAAATVASCIIIRSILQPEPVLL